MIDYAKLRKTADISLLFNLAYAEKQVFGVFDFQIVEVVIVGDIPSDA